MRLRPFNPKQGQIYALPYGGRFKCLGVGDCYRHNALMQNVISGWTIEAHGIKLHEDGKHAGCIEWDYSTGGHFEGVADV